MTIEKSAYDKLKSTRRGRKPKEQQIESDTQKAEKKPLFPMGKVLSRAEAESLHEPLIAALGDEGHYADQLIWLKATQVQGKDIWGNIDDQEARALASLLLKRGQVSPAAATVVRTLVNAHDYMTVIALFAPRIYETQKVLREAPKRERKRRTLFREAT